MSRDMSEEALTVRQRVLRNAEEIVSQDRNVTYGGPEDSFASIAVYWSELFGHYISPAQVALALGLVKVARLQANMEHYDSWVDLAGYASCGAEVAGAEHSVGGS